MSDGTLITEETFDEGGNDKVQEKLKLFLTIVFTIYVIQLWNQVLSMFLQKYVYREQFSLKRLLAVAIVFTIVLVAILGQFKLPMHLLK